MSVDLFRIPDRGAPAAIAERHHRPRSDVGNSRALMQELLRIQGGQSSAGEAVTPDTAMRAAAVHACVRVVSEDVAKLPCILYRRTKEGGKERATDHPLYKLLKVHPNGWQTPMAFFGNGQAHQELRGNAFAYVTRVRGEPRELIPLHPDRVKVEQNADWSLTYSVLQRDGTWKPHPRENILHVPGLSLDGVNGISTIGYARETIGLALATEKHGALLFKNAAKPSGVIERPKDAPEWDEEAEKRFLDSFRAAYTGDEGAFRLALIQDGMKVTPLTMLNKDAQFLETRQYGRTEIAGLFRVPPHKIGDLTRATFSNIEHQALEYYGDGLMPRITRWEQALTRTLLSPAEQDEYFFEFLVDAVLRADFKTRMEGYAIALLNGVFNPNEVRAKENHNPRPGGDEYRVPANTVPSGAPSAPGTTPPNQEDGDGTA